MRQEGKIHNRNKEGEKDRGDRKKWANNDGGVE